MVHTQNPGSSEYIPIDGIFISISHKLHTSECLLVLPSTEVYETLLAAIKTPGQTEMITSKNRAFNREEKKLMAIFSSFLLTAPLVVMLFATAVSRM